MNQGFPKSARLRRRSEYLALQTRGRKLHTRSFLVFIGPRANPSVGAGAPAASRGGTPPLVADELRLGPSEAEPRSRIGITASKKVGGAVVRNRWKRCTREAFRRLRADFGHVDFEMVVVAKKDVPIPSARAIYDELRPLFERNGGGRRDGASSRNGRVAVSADAS
ncbi:MAG: ribonuclease P protein component [Myxococcales bacterium]|nr:ribonuclease P protein component [Myxococcales bacterium]